MRKRLKAKRGKKMLSAKRSNLGSPEVITYGAKAIWGNFSKSAIIAESAEKMVFIIDTGVSDQTNDLNLNEEWSRSWIENESPFSDGVGHGTHVAGTIASIANDSGIIGIAPGAEVISLKVIDNQGAPAPYQSFIDAIQYAYSIVTQHGIPLEDVVVNFSLGAPASNTLEAAVRDTANQGLRFALSAGNLGMDADERSPANAGDHANVYTVGAVNRIGEIPSWSNWDIPSSSDEDDVDGVAPGVGILSYEGDGKLGTRSGSSMAAAHVAGALLLGEITAGPNGLAGVTEHREPQLQLAALHHNHAIKVASQPQRKRLLKSNLDTSAPQPESSFKPENLFQGKSIKNRKASSPHAFLDIRTTRLATPQKNTLLNALSYKREDFSLAQQDGWGNPSTILGWDCTLLM
jgi:hypothetical protein